MNNLNALIFFFQLVNLLGFTISAQSVVSENLVSAFKDKNDEVIGDVLKKMPGIDVTESGLITCNGIPINRFYIENMDMLQGRYGIAVKNIAVDDISIVQVLENHQPVKALEKIQLMDRAAINLKIKEGKKGIFGIFAMLGIGADTDLLWQEELTSTYFGKTRQHLFAYKTNNSSVDLSNELRSFTYDNSIDPLQLAYVQQPNPPAIPSDRYLFNNSHAAILNNLFKLKNDVEINANVAFYHNEDLRYGFSRTSYLLPGEERLIVSEDMSTQEITNRIEGEFRCNLNKERTYFNNYLNVASNRNNNRSDVNIPLPVEQQLNNQSFSANNTTQWIKRVENEKGVEILLKNAFHTRPHRLTVTPGSFPNLSNEGKEYYSLTQNIRNEAFASNNRFSFLSAAVIGNLRLNPSANLNLEHQKLVSNFDFTDRQSVLHPILDNNLRNDRTWVRLSTGVSLDGSFQTNNLKANFYLPVSYRYTEINNRLLNPGVLHEGKFRFHPSFLVQYNFSFRWEMTVNGSYQTQDLFPETLYSGCILQNYRNINRYDTRLFESNKWGSSLDITYKNIPDMFLASGGISYNRYYREGIYGQTFVGLLTFSQLVMQPNNGNDFSINGHISKGFDWKDLTLSTDGSWGKNESDWLRQENFARCNIRRMNVNISAEMTLTEWLIAEYKASWGRSRSKVSTGDQFPLIQSFNEHWSADVSLPFGIGLSGMMEHYYINRTDRNKNSFLLDLGLSYTRRGVSYSLEWSNILNVTRFVSASYGSLNSYYSEYDICPRAVMLVARFKLL